MGIALPEDNCIDIYTQDVGFLAVVRDGAIIGYNVLVGGGMGTTPSAKKTFPALAKRMAFVKPDQAVDVAKAILKVQRDYGNREDRKVARMKYLVANWGIEKFRRAVEEYFGQPLDDCTEDDVHGFDDHMGWQEQGDGKWSYGLNIENGRLYDNENHQLKGGAAGGLPGVRHRNPNDGPPECHLHRYRRRRQRETDLADQAEQYADHGANQHSTSLVDVLRRTADLWPGDHRKRTTTCPASSTRSKRRWRNSVWTRNVSRSA